MADVPEMRPLVIVDNDKGQNKLTAAMWDENERIWRTSEGFAFDGDKPTEAEEILVAMKSFSDLF